MTRLSRRARGENAVRPAEAVARLRAPGILLGIGLGGFVDGIVLHQILQWHHLLSSEGGQSTKTVAGLEANTLADGLFHAAAWVAVVVGLTLLWRRTNEWRRPASGSALVGFMLVGWGGFDVVEGIVDHQLLGLHHVREGAGHQTAYDVGFLVLGAALVAAGLLLALRDDREPVA